MSAPRQAPRSSGVGAALRRCRPRARREGDLRPTDVLGAFFVLGIGFLAAGALAAVANALTAWPWGGWLSLHLAFVGGVSQLVLGASQFFAGAFLATDPPPRALVRLQLLSWNAGTVLLALAVPARAAAPTWAAVALLLAGLGAYVAALWRMRARSLRRAPWATRWYASGAGFLALGILAGALLARGTLWTHGDLLSAHMVLNLGGWFGAAIVGTLHTFYPSLTGTQLRHPRLQDLAFAGWMAGVLAITVGYGWSIETATVAGWLALTVAALALGLNVIACLRDAQRPLSLPARVVGLAQLFLVIGLILATATAIDAGASGALAGSAAVPVGTLLVAGWIALTVLGSLLHLLAVLVRVRDHSQPLPIPRPGRDGLIAALAAVGVLGLALWQAGDLAGRAAPALALLLAYVALGSRVALLSVRVLRRARPSI